jgi:hypothetical protein
MSTEDLLEIMKLLSAEKEQIDASLRRNGRDVFQLGRVAGLDLALTMLDEKFGVELDAYEKQGEETEG